MSRTTAVHVRYKSLYISLPSSAKQQREMTKISRCLESVNDARLNFIFLLWNLTLYSIFIFEIVLTVRNEVILIVVVLCIAVVVSPFISSQSLDSYISPKMVLCPNYHKKNFPYSAGSFHYLI